MGFTAPGIITLPLEAPDTGTLKKLITDARMDEINRRIADLTTLGNRNLVAWLRSKRQQLINTHALSHSASASGTLFSSKVYIPVQEFPECNFIGLILGPKGSTQKQLERITKSRIYIRGSYKDKHMEPLHCYITSETQECLEKAIAVIENLIEESVLFGDNNKLKTLQLQAINSRKGIDNKSISPWKRFYCWWIYHNKARQ
ncbi:hypothetical protein HK407_02g04060 [Ordospora pajunii]|jgi:protein quaking|uniref:uncharacterized protein n=1 Tax=Ordospora pajunii TaxID=3039483 RepID=UPI0029526D7C|nr:uncharacterized protein HK407_02g04060 [Ordospora pajunii]KAH9411959.1 hypothetical protein HK407_02g04060 [Ordospora pajunii]